jgi:dTDP-4-amino-4,6-dideoxygalactose transaminase
MPAYGRFATPGAYPVTEDLHNRLLCVPLFGDLTSDDVDSICDLVVAAVGS